MIPYNKINCTVPSMNIDDVMGILNKLKEDGANRVYISTDDGHRGYEFFGVQLKEV